MNIFINIISENQIIFFDDNNLKVVEMKKNEEFANIINKNIHWKEIKNIFYVKGPSYFTILRNMSVFLNTFKIFTKNINFYGINSKDYLFIENPKANICFIASGKKDSYLFKKDEVYKKISNNEIEKISNKYQFIGGNLDLLKNNESKYIKPIETSKILKNMLKLKNSFEKNSINIDYGERPRIG
jgi:tRNA A37 threonylcarbamoyladenosine modification protein TsaB